MRLLIYGAGALGQGLGGLLATAGHQVDLLVRERYAVALRQQGLSVDGVLGNYRCPAGSLRVLTSLAEADSRYDYTLLTTKSYDTREAALDLLQLGDAAGVVVSMQNGCGNVEELVQRFGARRVLGAMVITGFTIPEPGRVTVTVIADAIHVGTSSGGERRDAAETLAATLSAAGHPCEAVSDIHQSLYAKLLYNCALNPLGALLGVHYGALAENPDTKRQLAVIVGETFAVIQAMGGRLPWPEASAYCRHLFTTLIPATASHRSSMLQDLERGKRTEVEALVGYVALQGARLAVATPVCDMLATMIRFRESLATGSTAGATAVLPASESKS